MIAGAPRTKRSDLAIAGAIFALSLALLIPTNSLYGTTYDEPIYQSKAVQALEWLRLAVTSPSLAVTPAAIERYWHAKDQHPGFVKLLSALSGATLGRLAPPGEAMRTGTNLLAALCLAAVYLFTAGLWGRAAGLCAVGALLLMPRVFAHCHLAALDAPVMAMTFLVLAASWRACVAHERPRRAWAWALVAGALWGLALSTKLNAFFVPFVVFPWALVFARQSVGRLAVAFAALGPLLFLATWPWLWHETGPRFWEYFHFHFRHWEIAVTYFGKSYDVAPWHYPLVMTAITTPPVTLALALVGLGALRLRRPFTAQGAALALMAWALLVNYVPSCLPDTPKYNGVRLFLPVFPLLAVLAAVGFRTCLDWLLRRMGGAVRDAGLRRRLTALALFLALIGPLAATARFTPFHLSYYNALIGGLPGAARAGMEPTYWGETYRSAALWLAREAEPGATVWIEPAGFESTVRLFELGPLRPDLRFSAGPEGIREADFAVTQNKPTEFSDITRRLVATRRPVFTDGMDGVPLVYVFRVGGDAGAGG